MATDTLHLYYGGEYLILFLDSFLREFIYLLVIPNRNNDDSHRSFFLNQLLYNADT